MADSLTLNSAALRTKPSYRDTHIIVEWEGRWYEIPKSMLSAIREGNK